MKEALSSSETSALQEPHGVTSKNTPFFIVTAVKTSNITYYPSCFKYKTGRWVMFRIVTVIHYWNVLRRRPSAGCSTGMSVEEQMRLNLSSRILYEMSSLGVTESLMFSESCRPNRHSFFAGQTLINGRPCYVVAAHCFRCKIEIPLFSFRLAIYSAFAGTSCIKANWYILAANTFSLALRQREELCGAEHYSRGHKLCSHSVVSQNFMEPDGSLPRSQKLSTCIYPEPDQSSPKHPILYLKSPPTSRSS
jgi:hypothetical protein